jgi:plasmid stabilization system protein ParE
MTAFVLHPEAYADLDEIWEYIADDNLDAADRVRRDRRHTQRKRLNHPKAEKATLISERGLYLCRQRPTLPHTFACSTIGPAGLNFRVRDGNGWSPRGKITDKS